MSVDRKHLHEIPSEFLPAYDLDSDSFSAFCAWRCFEPTEDSLTAFGGDVEDEFFDEWLHSMEDSI